MGPFAKASFSLAIVAMLAACDTSSSTQSAPALTKFEQNLLNAPLPQKAVDILGISSIRFVCAIYDDDSSNTNEAAETIKWLKHIGLLSAEHPDAKPESTPQHRSRSGLFVISEQTNQMAWYNSNIFPALASGCACGKGAQFVKSKAGIRLVGRIVPNEYNQAGYWLEGRWQEPKDGRFCGD